MNQKNIKLIVSDLDGTLLNNSNEIGDFTVKTLLDYQQKGYIVVLASGRFQKEIMKYANQLKLSEHHGWIVCANGYEVHNLEKQQLFTFDAITKKEAQALAKLASAYHLSQYVKIKDTYHLCIQALTHGLLKVGKNALTIAQKCGLKKGIYTIHLLNETKIVRKMDIDCDVFKMAFIAPASKLKQFIKKVDELYPKMYSFYYVNPLSVEITRNTVSKKNAVAYICEQLDLDLSQVIAFGDSGNDEPLLMSAGIGITMKNGTKRALAKAKILSEKSNDEDGVALACLKYLEENDERN